LEYFPSIFSDLRADADMTTSTTDMPSFVLHSGHAPFFDLEKTIDLDGL